MGFGETILAGLVVVAVAAVGNRLFGWITLDDLGRWRRHAKAAQDEASKIQTPVSSAPTVAVSAPAREPDGATVTPAPPPRFRILIARLHSDPDDRFREMIADAIERIGGVEAMTVAAEIALQEGVPPSERDRAAQALLAEQRGDLLIAGRYLSDHDGLRLRMINPDEGVAGVHGLTLDDPFELPATFTEATVAALQAIALGRIAVTDQQAGGFLVDRLGPALERLRPLLDGLKHHLPRADAWQLVGAVAAAEWRLGGQSGQDDPLRRAVRHCRDALASGDLQDGAKVRWQVVLGTALSILGEREGSAERIAEAVDAFRGALAVFEEFTAPGYAEIAHGNLQQAEAALAAVRGG